MPGALAGRTTSRGFAAAAFVFGHFLLCPLPATALRKRRHLGTTRSSINNSSIAPLSEAEAWIERRHHDVVLRRPPVVPLLVEDADADNSRAARFVNVFEHTLPEDADAYISRAARFVNVVEHSLPEAADAGIRRAARFAQHDANSALEVKAHRIDPWLSKGLWILAGLCASVAWLFCWYSSSRESSEDESEPEGEVSRKAIQAQRVDAQRPPPVPGTASATAKHLGVPRLSNSYPVHAHFSIATDTSGETEVYNAFSDQHKSITVEETRELMQQAYRQ